MDADKLRKVGLTLRVVGGVLMLTSIILKATMEKNNNNVEGEKTTINVDIGTQTPSDDLNSKISAGEDIINLSPVAEEPEEAYTPDPNEGFVYQAPSEGINPTEDPDFKPEWAGDHFALFHITPDLETVQDTIDNPTFLRLAEDTDGSYEKFITKYLTLSRDKIEAETGLKYDFTLIKYPHDYYPASWEYKEGWDLFSIEWKEAN